MNQELKDLYKEQEKANEVIQKLRETQSVGEVSDIVDELSLDMLRVMLKKIVYSRGAVLAEEKLKTRLVTLWVEVGISFDQLKSILPDDVELLSVSRFDSNQDIASARVPSSYKLDASQMEGGMSVYELMRMTKIEEK